MIKKKDIVKHILTGERMLVLRFMPEGKLVEVRLSDYRNEYFNLWELEKVEEEVVPARKWEEDPRKVGGRS